MTLALGAMLAPIDRALARQDFAAKRGHDRPMSRTPPDAEERLAGRTVDASAYHPDRSSMMNTRLVAIALAFSLAGQAAPSIAQSPDRWRGGDASGRQWDREAFWRGAPTGLRERIAMSLCGTCSPAKRRIPQFREDWSD